MTTEHTTALFGLGSMGMGMAVVLARAGIATHGFDVRPAKEEAFIASGGATGGLAEVASCVDSVVSVVSNAAQTEAILFGADGGNGVVAQLATGTVIISCATVPPEFARGMEQRCEAAGMLYLDAPVSGGSLKASDGTLSVMASGSAAAFAGAKPVLDAVSATVFNLGDKAGAGSVMKAVNQLLAGVHLVAMAEAMAFGISQGVDAKTFMDVIPQCAGTSWILENRGPHVVAGDYRPSSTVSIWPKDLGIVTAIAKLSNFPAPITAAALEQYAKAVDAGLGNEDDAAVVKVYAQAAGLALPVKD